MRTLLSACLVFSLCLTAANRASAQAVKKKTQPAPAARMARTGTARGAQSLKPAADLDQQLAKWQPYRMPFNGAGLSARERQLVDKLVEANHYIDYIYWRQSDSEALALLRRLMNSRNPRDQKIARMLRINGSRFDLLEEERPFVGTESLSPGRGFYPEGITREEIEKYVAAHPEKKKAIYDERTVVRRNGGELDAIPYRVAYREFLLPAARLLKEAAALSDDPAFARFLTLRADALLTDDYYPSDIAWLELNDPKFDIIYAPYETYLDGLLGVKTSYGGAVMIRNREESQKLALYQKYVPDIQEALPLPPEDRPSKQKHLTPMEVMD